MRLSRCVGTVALAAGLVVSHASEALARGPAGSATPLPGPSELYVVVTSDGSRYEGELVENVVGDHVTIRLASGEIRGFDVRDVKSMDLARPAMPPASMFTPFAGVLPGVPRTYEGPDAVPVHIMSTGAESASLEQESASGWVPVCAMPCTTTVDPKATYKLFASEPFHFPAGGPLDLKADLRTRQHNMGWGVGLITTGSVTWIPGLFLLIGMFDGPSADGSTGTPSTAETAIGWTIIGASAAVTIAGIVMLATPASTTLTDVSGRRVARGPGIPLGRGVDLTPSGLRF